MEITKNAVYELRILDMTSEGSGVARIDGYAVFVPDTAVGDLCRVKLVKKGKTFGYGKVEALIEPSPDRTDPDCDKFIRCGGCAYRHITYEAELAIKERVVRDAFTRIGHIDAPVDPILGSERRTGYRNKAQYPVGTSPDGKLISGFYARRSHRIISGGGCALQPALFAQIQETVLCFLEEQHVPAYNEETGRGLIRHIYLRQAEVTGEVMVCLVVTDDKVRWAKDLSELLQSRFPQVKSVVLNQNDRQTNVILGPRCRTIGGSDTIIDELCGIRVKLSPLSFYQVNRSQAEALYRRAIELAALKEDDVLLDLYCGAGTIGLSASHLVRELIGVEIVPEAVENARENAALNGITNARFLCGDAGQAAAQLAEEGLCPSVIIVDPPRKGLDAVVIDAIVKMAPERLVMVSCNPSTAARDAALLAERGYAASRISPVDMFPRTTHVECVVLMTRQ